MSRSPTRRMTESRMAVERQEIGQRVARLIERYHTLEVLPLRLALHWHLKPWPVRTALWLVGKRPNIGAIVDARMKELDKDMILPCPAEKGGFKCQHPDGQNHDGVHFRLSTLSGQRIEWEDEPEAA